MVELEIAFFEFYRKYYMQRFSPIFDDEMLSELPVDTPKGMICYLDYGRVE